MPNMPSKLSPTTERFLILLALVCWTITAAQIIDAMSYPHFAKRHHMTLGVLSILGLLACFAWARAKTLGRYAVLTMAILYLLFYALRTYVLLYVPILKHSSPVEAVERLVTIVWTLAAHHVSQGRVLAGLSELFFEWLMPLLQLTIVAAMLWPLVRGSGGDATRAVRA
jgi:hypothetical protein